jgi:HSP20 family protein
LSRGEEEIDMLRRRSLFGEGMEPFAEFERLFRRPFGELGEFLPQWTTQRLLPAVPVAAEFMPAVECYTKDKQLYLKVELPGVDPKLVEVAVVGNMLTIKGEKKEERKLEEENVFFREIARGRFERTFQLPEGVKKEQINATFQNGVLEVVLPAAGIEAARKVPIEIQELGKKTIKAA